MKFWARGRVGTWASKARGRVGAWAREARGARSLGTLERDDVEETINDMTEKLRRIGQLIDDCDEHIKESAWLNQWRTDLDEVLQKDVFPKGMPYT